MNSQNKDSNFKTILFLLLFLSAWDIFAIAVRGRVYSRQKSKGEGGVQVFVTETKKAYTTDADGFFDAELPSAGDFTFKIVRPTGEITSIGKNVSQDGELINLYTDKVEVPKGAINVEGTKDKTILSRYKLKYDEIKRLPGTMGEALNALQTVPGVFQPPFFGGGNGAQPGAFVCRGANPNSNTILYDDLPIAYAYHFDSLNSVIHNDLIKTIDIYTGAYPANFANATGCVIEIESSDKPPKRSGQANLSLIMGQAMYQTPLFNGKGYLAAGGKVGYLDKTIGATGLIPEGIRLPQYTSSNVKFIYDINADHQISFISLTASDNFVANFSNKPNNDPTKDPLAAVAGARVAAGQGYRTTAPRHIWTVNSKITNRFTLINYDPFAKVNVKFGTIESDFIARAPYTGLRQDMYINAGNMLKIDLGTEYRLFSYNLSGFNVQQTDPNNLSPNPYNTANPDFQKKDITQKTPTNYANAYTTLHFTFGKLKIEPGLRYDYVGYSKQGVLGPRGTVSYKLEGFLKGTTFFAGAGDYYRYPFFSDAISKESGNPDIKFEKARKYGGGIEQDISDILSVKTEMFKQEFTDLIVSDPYISAPYGVNPDKTQLLTQPIVANRALNFSNKGTGWARGYELYIKKNPKPGVKDWYGWISYTWSQNFRNTNIYNSNADPSAGRILTSDELRLRSMWNNSRETLGDYDVTHLLSVVFGWRINADYQVGGRWFYRTAFPVTPVIGDDGGQFRNPANGQTFWNPQYSNNPYSAEYVNSRRLPDYHRLDFRFDKFMNYEWGFINLYFEVINVYMRQNTVGENFDTTRPFSKTNPSPQYDFFLLRNNGRISPFFNVGMEVRF